MLPSLELLDDAEMDWIDDPFRPIIPFYPTYWVKLNADAVLASSWILSGSLEKLYICWKDIVY